MMLATLSGSVPLPVNYFGSNGNNKIFNFYVPID
mgnify:CR=1 FL=1|jgi:hypothetical protein